MPRIPLHIALSPAASASAPAPPENPLPTLLHTPTGLALLELQGTIHFPTPTASSPPTTTIGKLVFPLYHPRARHPTAGDSDTAWMKRVYMYVGKGQRMTGECKKLASPIGILRKRVGRERGGGDVDVDMDADGHDGLQERRRPREEEEELEIVEIVKYKIVFSARPEPISGVVEG